MSKRNTQTTQAGTATALAPVVASETLTPSEAEKATSLENLPGGAEVKPARLPEPPVSPALQRVRELKAAITERIKELLAHRAAIDTELAELGHDAEPPAFVTGSPARTTSRKPATGKNKGKTNAESFCKICNIAGHDGRKHRFQEPKKKFTTAELAAM